MTWNSLADFSQQELPYPQGRQLVHAWWVQTCCTMHGRHVDSGEQLKSAGCRHTHLSVCVHWLSAASVLAVQCLFCMPAPSWASETFVNLDLRVGRHCLESELSIPL